LVPRGLLAGSGVPESRRIVTFGNEQAEQLRRDLMAFKGIGHRPRSLERPKDILRFVNTWGMLSRGPSMPEPSLGCERVGAVRDGLRPFVEAACGIPHAQTYLATLKSGTLESGFRGSLTLNRVRSGYQATIEALALRDVLTLFVQEWAETPVVGCENPLCKEHVFGRRFCSDLCSGRVRIRRAKKMRRVRDRLEAGELPRAVAARYNLPLDDVEAKKREMKARQRIAARKPKGARR
jgi:hypothetical protein